MPASTQGVAVEADAGDPAALERRCRAGGTPTASWSMTATSWPWLSRLSARVEPTRPQPMITKCTTPTLHASASRGRCAAPLHAHGRPSSVWPCRPSGRVAQAAARRPRHAQRPARRDAAAQADRPAGLRQRRPVVGRLRPGRDLPDPVGRRAVGATHFSWKIGLARRRRHARRSSRPTGRTCTPTPPAAATTRWPRPTSGPSAGPDRGQRPAGRLRPDRRGVDLLRRAERRRGAAVRPRARGRSSPSRWSCC